MQLREALWTGLAEIRLHKTRSALSCVAIAIGVAAMVYTFSQISGMRQRFDKASKLAGPGRMEIERKEGYVSRGLSPGLTWRDAEAIRERWPELTMVYPLVRRHGARLTFPGFKSEDIQVQAVTEEWTRRDWVFTKQGRFFDSRDVADSARVCVVIQPGGWIKKPFWARWFPETPLERVLKRRELLGLKVNLEGHLFTVIGILREPPKDRDPRWFRRHWGGGGGTVLVPISTYRHLFSPRGRAKNVDQVDAIQVDTGDENTAALYRRRIEGLLKARHRGEVDYQIRDYREFMTGILERMRKFAWAILAIGVVAILAGGIGIMNVTLATVYSRVREVGIRRALGATRADIVAQFLVEAALLGTAGGAAGVALGAGMVTYLAPRADRMGAVSPAHVAGALVIAAATSLLFALYPAYEAARMDPIEALRYE